MVHKVFCLGKAPTATKVPDTAELQMGSLPGLSEVHIL